MNVLVLNNYRLSTLPYPEWLDAEVTLVTDASCLEAGPGYADVVSFEDYTGNPLIEYEVVRLHEKHGFDRLIAMSELDLLRAARLRERLGIPGQDVAGATAFRDKVTMKRALRAGGVPITPFAPVEHATDLVGFAREHGFPLVLKPRRGAGSMGVHVLGDEDALVELLRATPALGGDERPRLIAEKYVPHQLFHVDGVVIGGEVRLIWPSRMTSCLGHLDGDPLVTALLDADDPLVGPLCELTRRALAALPTPATTMFHAEVFQRPDGELVFNEIACRAGGGEVAGVLLLGFGHDIVELYVRAALTDRLDADLPEKPLRGAGFVIVPPRPGVLAAAPADCPVPGVAEYRLGRAVGDTMTAAAHSVDELALFTATGSSSAEVTATLTTAAKWFSDACVIDPVAEP